MTEYTATWTRPNDSVKHVIYFDDIPIKTVGDVANTVIYVGGGKTGNVGVKGFDLWDNESVLSNVIVKTTVLDSTEYIPGDGTTDWEYLIKADVSLGQILPASDASLSWSQGGKFGFIPLTQNFELTCSNIFYTGETSGQASFGLAAGSYKNRNDYYDFAISSGGSISAFEFATRVTGYTTFDPSYIYKIEGIGDTINYYYNDVLIGVSPTKRTADMACVFSYYGKFKGFTNIKLTFK